MLRAIWIRTSGKKYSWFGQGFLRSLGGVPDEIFDEGFQGLPLVLRDSLKDFSRSSDQSRNTFYLKLIPYIHCI